MLHKKCAVPVGTATFAVGMVGFFEGAIFRTDDGFSITHKRTHVDSFLGEEIHLQSLQTISGLTLLGIAIVTCAKLIIGRRFTENPESREDFSPLAWIKGCH